MPEIFVKRKKKLNITLDSISKKQVGILKNTTWNVFFSKGTFKTFPGKSATNQLITTCNSNKNII